MKLNWQRVSSFPFLAHVSFQMSKKNIIIIFEVSHKIRKFIVGLKKLTWNVCKKCIAENALRLEYTITYFCGWKIFICLRQTYFEHEEMFFFLFWTLTFLILYCGINQVETIPRVVCYFFLFSFVEGIFLTPKLFPGSIYWFQFFRHQI